jgi:hypothetical protein
VPPLIVRIESKMNHDTAKNVISCLRGYSYGTNESDKDLVTRALRHHPDVGHIAGFAMVMYYSAKRAMPEYDLPIFIAVIATASVIAWFTRRRLKRLQYVQDLFLASASSTITDALKTECESGPGE